MASDVAAFGGELNEPTGCAEIAFDTLAILVNLTEVELRLAVAVA